MKRKISSASWAATMSFGMHSTTQAYGSSTAAASQVRFIWPTDTRESQASLVSFTDNADLV
jgi:hypothetical protein